MSQTKRSRVVCVVLASGVGRRMGGPKALLHWPPAGSLADAHVHFRRNDCARVVIVTRDHIAARLGSIAAQLVISHEPDELGPAGSIAAAVRAHALDDADHVLVTPVDVPPVGEATVAQLLSALDTASAAKPLYRGRGGHPVACKAAIIRDAYTHDTPILRDVLAGLGPRCVNVPVEDSSVLTDLDTGEAYRACTGHLPRFVP